jgi:two-component system, OmpR family, sensor histidine kinase SenX3
MVISSRRKATVFFITLGAAMVALAIALNVSWIILNWREVVPLVLGIIFFIIIIAGLILNTIFLVREIRKNEQHDSFINAVTHELKTPIASIRLYLETLQKREVTEDRRKEFYGIMLQDTERLMSTVDQVLRAAKPGQREELHTKIEVDVETLARECVELARVRHHLGPEALQFSSSVKGHDALVLGDPEELRVAVTNVIDNAIKYSTESIEVRVEVLAPKQNQVIVQVSDRGIGIARGELKQIFKRFYRVPRRAVATVKGTGLGLFIVRSIARRHGGDAFIESPGEGKGSTVRIELPGMYAA